MLFIGCSKNLLKTNFTRYFTRIYTQVMFCLLAIFCASMMTHTAMAEPIKITLAAEDGWPPFADEFGSGISHNLIQQAFKQVNVEVSTIVVPYTRGLIMTERGTVDGVFNVTKEQSTQERFVFGNEPLFTVNASFFFAKTQTVIAKDKWQLPLGSVIGIIDGYEYGDELLQLINQRQLKIVKVNSQRQLINLLLVNRIDGAIMYDMVADVYIEQMGVKQDIVAQFMNHTSEIFVAFSKQNPQATELSLLLDKGLQQLKQQGHYQKLLVPLDF
ncbi:substrate-binding periplasmic protein [Shewanella sp. MF05960]|uniref:substrate-binding periplasmic protein n=1 Tax=Shewanella sp. MF05960 TaxID=3434874 RepID=UPI003D79989F